MFCYCEKITFLLCKLVLSTYVGYEGFLVHVYFVQSSLWWTNILFMGISNTLLGCHIMLGKLGEAPAMLRARILCWLLQCLGKCLKPHMHNGGTEPFFKYKLHTHVKMWESVFIWLKPLTLFFTDLATLSKWSLAHTIKKSCDFYGHNIPSSFPITIGYCQS